MGPARSPVLVCRAPGLSRMDSRDTGGGRGLHSAGGDARTGTGQGRGRTNGSAADAAGGSAAVSAETVRRAGCERRIRGCRDGRTAPLGRGALRRWPDALRRRRRSAHTNRQARAAAARLTGCVGLALAHRIRHARFRPDVRRRIVSVYRPQSASRPAYPGAWRVSPAEPDGRRAGQRRESVATRVLRGARSSGLQICSPGGAIGGANPDDGTGLVPARWPERDSTRAPARPPARPRARSAMPSRTSTGARLRA